MVTTSNKFAALSSNAEEVEKEEEQEEVQTQEGQVETGLSSCTGPKGHGKGKCLGLGADGLSYRSILTIIQGHFQIGGGRKFEELARYIWSSGDWPENCPAPKLQSSHCAA